MTIHFRLVRTLAVVFLATFATPQELTLNSTLHSTISGVPLAFTNENVIFTCITRGSNIMGWSSDEYIGTGGRRLDFISTNPPGTSRTSGETRAELISASEDEFIISRLYIRVQPTFPIATVKCENVGAGTMTSLTFPLADDISLSCDQQVVCPGDALTCVCATGQSNTLIWGVDGNERQFTLNDSLNTRRNVPGSSAFVTLTENSARNGVRVMRSNLTVNTSLNLLDNVILTCENVDRAMTRPFIIPIDENCPMIQVTTSDEKPNAPEPSSSGNLIAAVVVPVIFAIGVIVIAVIVLIASYLAKYKPLKEECDRKDQEKEEALGTLSMQKDNEKQTALTSLTEQKNQEKEVALKLLTEQKNQEKGKALENLTKQKNQEKEKALENLTKQKNQEKEKALENLTKQKDGEKESALKELAKQLGSDGTTSTVHGTVSTHSGTSTSSRPTYSGVNYNYSHIDRRSATAAHTHDTRRSSHNI